MKTALKYRILSIAILSVFNSIYSQDVSQSAKILEHLKNPSGDHILVVSHRGDWRYAPENSLQAVQRCIDLGVDIVELDFRLTKDGHLVAMHDETVNRTTNGTGKVSEFSLQEIKKLRLKNACGVRHSRQQVPTLEEVMKLVKGKVMVNLDKTESRWVREAYEVLKKTGTIDQAIFKGNDTFEVMKEKYGALMDSIIYMPKLWPKNKKVRAYREAYESTINPFYYETLFDSEKAETFAMIQDLRRDGDGFLAIALWDDLCAGRTDEVALLEGPEKAWGWLIEKGATGVMTDRPKELMEYLKSKALRNP
ncbi:MAG: glycerophosphodiester phosphodiesterase family protein [Bacteroidota bacterium]